MEYLKVLIVDDEVLIAEDLKDFLKSFGIKRFNLAHDKESAITAINLFEPNVVLLDIRMEKELDGLDIADYLNNKNIPFIYVTAHSDVKTIKEIVKTQPLGYITKPFKKTELLIYINLAIAHLENNDKKQLSIKDGHQTIFIQHNDINYIESERNYVNIYCDSKKYLCRQSLDSVFKELPDTQFFKIHRSYIINIKKINSFNKKEVFINQNALPIARSILAEFEKMMKEHA